MPDRSLARVAAVAWREFRYTALTKSFLFGAVALPVVMLGILALLPPLLVSQLKPLEGRVAVVDPSGRFESAFRATLETEESGELPEEVRQGIAELGFGDGSGLIQQELARAARASTPDVIAVTIDDGTSVETLKEQARAGEWVGVVSLPASELATNGPANPSGGPIELFVPSELSPRNAQDLRELLRKSVVRARFAGRDDEFERVTDLLARPPLEIVRLGETGGESEES